MLVTATAVVRTLTLPLRRADTGLALGAARNAAASVAVRQARRLEDARTLRDLQRLDPPAPGEDAREALRDGR